MLIDVLVQYSRKIFTHSTGKKIYTIFKREFARRYIIMGYALSRIRQQSLRVCSDCRDKMMSFPTLWRFCSITSFFIISFISPHVVYAQTSIYSEVLHFESASEIEPFYRVAFSPDDKLLAVGTGRGKGIQIRDAKTGQLVRTLLDRTVSNTEVFRILFPQWSLDGRFVAGVSFGADNSPNSNIGILYVWNVRTGDRVTFPNRKDASSSDADRSGNVASLYVSWRPNSSELLITDIDGKIRLFDFPSGKLRWIASPYVQTYVDWPCQPQWNGDGTRFVCIGNNVQAIFDGDSGKHLFDLKDELSRDAHPQWTHDGKYILNVDVGDGGNALEINAWDAMNGQKLKFPLLKGLPFTIHPNSNWIAYVPAERTAHKVFIANLKTGQTLTAIDLDSWESDPVWSSTGKYLAVIDEQRSIHIFVDNTVGF
jgi:WD40 repeat protein